MIAAAVDVLKLVIKSLKSLLEAERALIHATLLPFGVSYKESTGSPRSTTMANEEHLAILQQGVDVWNAWRAANPQARPDLIEANLRHANLGQADMHQADLYRVNLSWADMHQAGLSGADLRQADLTGTNLSEANLAEANLSEANLAEANLTMADLMRASLIGAHLGQARLRMADLSGTDLSGAILSMANLSGAYLDASVFVNNDLSNSKGLDVVIHGGPSEITVSTLVKSKGKLPEIFLRGCGVPQSFIEYLPSLIGAMQSIQFYSCFISYSTKDEEFAKRLHSRMRDNNLHVWFANEDLKGGHKLHEQIDEAIRVYDKLILVLSQESIHSKWVKNEIRRTRKAELANNQRKFFPIGLMDFREIEDWECLDPETGTDLAAEIREYFIPDFTHWTDHKAFEREFAKLLDALKAVDAVPAPRIEPKSNPQNPQTVIAAKKRRLEKLEEQAAIKGISTPPEVANEIEDLRRELRELGGS
jgi:uncharacterized protein YjbI with pentapeptide repeats